MTIGFCLTRLQDAVVQLAPHSLDRIQLGEDGRVLLVGLGAVQVVAVLLELVVEARPLGLEVRDLRLDVPNPGVKLLETLTDLEQQSGLAVQVPLRGLQSSPEAAELALHPIKLRQVFHQAHAATAPARGEDRLSPACLG